MARSVNEEKLLYGTARLVRITKTVKFMAIRQKSVKELRKYAVNETFCNAPKCFIVVQIPLNFDIINYASR